MTSEGGVDLAMGRQKALRLTGRFESPHLSLSLRSGLMRYFGAVVDPLVLTMLNAGHDLLFGGSVAFEFVRDQHARHVTKPLEQFAKEALRRLPVASALRENIKRGAVLVHRSPQVMMLALDGQHDLLSRPKEFRPRPLPERSMNLSIHTAPIKQTKLPCRAASV
jgi:hypothetical protein